MIMPCLQKSKYNSRIKVRENEENTRLISKRSTVVVLGHRQEAAEQTLCTCQDQATCSLCCAQGGAETLVIGLAARIQGPLRGGRARHSCTGPMVLMRSRRIVTITGSRFDECESRSARCVRPGPVSSGNPYDPVSKVVSMFYSTTSGFSDLPQMKRSQDNLAVQVCSAPSRWAACRSYVVAVQSAGLRKAGWPASAGADRAHTGTL